MSDDLTTARARIAELEAQVEALYADEEVMRAERNDAWRARDEVMAVIGENLVACVRKLEAWAARWKRLAQSLRVRGVCANQTAHVAVVERVKEHYEARLDERDAEIEAMRDVCEAADAFDTWSGIEEDRRLKEAVRRWRERQGQ